LYNLVDDCLDHSATPTHQQSEKVHNVYDKVSASYRGITIRFAHCYLQAILRFPCFNSIGQPYDIWVINDLIALRLKHWQTTSTAKKAVAKKVVTKKTAAKKGRTTKQSGVDSAA